MGTWLLVTLLPFGHLQGTHLRVQLLTESYQLVIGKVPCLSYQLAAQFDGEAFLQCIGLCTLIPIQFGNEGLKFSKVVCEFLLTLLQLVELGSCSCQRIRVTENIVENADNILNIGMGEGGAGLNIGKNLGLCAALNSVECVCHPQSWCREQCWVTEQLKPKLRNESFDLLMVSIEHGGIGNVTAMAWGQRGGHTSTGRNISSGGCFGHGRLFSIQYGLS